MSDTQNSVHVTIVTPFGVKEEYNVLHVRLPGMMGDFGVLYGHVPFLTALRVGKITLNLNNGKEVVWAVAGGFCEVLNNQVNILAENAENAETIDIERAKQAKERALKRLSDQDHDIDTKRARYALARALNRISIAGR